jgi:hypothetical protein
MSGVGRDKLSLELVASLPHLVISSTGESTDFSKAGAYPRSSQIIARCTMVSAAFSMSWRLTHSRRE